jgi:hypothetical protein
MVRMIHQFSWMMLIAAVSGCAMPGKYPEKYYSCEGLIGEINKGHDKVLYEDSLTFRVTLKNGHGTVNVVGNELPGEWEGMYYICERSDAAIYFEHMPVNINQCYSSNTARLGSLNLVSGEGQLQLVTGETYLDSSSYFDFVCKESKPPVDK